MKILSSISNLFKSKNTVEPLKKKEILYPTPRNYGNYLKYRPRYLSTPTDYYKLIRQGNQSELIAYSRDLVASMGDISAAICNKASWCFQEGGDLVYCGSEENEKWAEEVMSWWNDYRAYSNVLGPSFNWKTSRKICSRTLDVDGEIFLLPIIGKDGRGKYQLIEFSHIGNRNSETSIIVDDHRAKQGEPNYNGLTSINGVVYDNGSPIAYKILGETPDKDLYTGALRHIFEPKFSTFNRGLPKLSEVILDALDYQDIKQYLKTSIKIESRIGLIRKNNTGYAEEDNQDVLKELLPTDNDINVPQTQNFPLSEEMNGEILYVQNDSDIYSFKTERPSANTQAYIQKLSETIYDALEWPEYKLGQASGAGVRAAEQLLRAVINDRQNLIDSAFMYAFLFILTRAMKMKDISSNKTPDWKMWRFTKGKQFSVDQGNEMKGDIENLKYGLTTKAIVASKYGYRITDIEKERMKEVTRLLTDASTLAKQFNVSIDFATQLLSMSSPNTPPSIEINSQPKETKDETKPENT